MFRRLKKLVSMIVLSSMFISVLPANAFGQQVDPVQTQNPIIASDTEVPIVKEIIEKREKNVKHFLKADGSYEAVVYSEAVHYLEDDQWIDIDNTLMDIKEEDTNDVLENQQNGFKIKIAQKANAAKLFNIQSDKYQITWDLVGAANSKSIVVPQDLSKLDSLTENQKKKNVLNTTSTVEYNDVYPDIDLQYQVKSESVKENFIIKKKTNINEFKYNLDVNNLVPQLLKDGSVAFFDDTDITKNVFDLQAPYMKDSAGKESNSIKVELTQTKKGYTLSMKPDTAWLEDKQRVYPITIDPSIGVRDYLKVDDCSVWDAYPNENLYTQLRVGRYQLGLCRTFIKFALPILTPADIVTNAKMQLVDIGSRAFNQIDVHKVNASWNEHTTTWNNKPGFDPVIQEYKNVPYFSQPTVVDNWEITNLVKEWYSTGVNYGLMLKKHDESITDYLSFFNSSEGTSGPVLTISYISNSGLEDYWTYHTNSVGRSGTGYVNDANGNLVVKNNLLNMSGNRIPVSIGINYNSTDRGSNIGFGNGWRLNLSQTVTKITLADGTLAYQYIDQDGTKHYFSNTGNYYTAEDGSNLYLSIYGGQVYDKYGYQLNFDNREYVGTGVLLSVKDANDNYMNLTYDTDGLTLKSVRDGVGRDINFNYQNGKLYSIVDPSNRATVFTYTDNQLTSITYPDGLCANYTYDTDNKLLSITDSDGYKVEYTYTSTTPYRVQDILETHTDSTLGSENTISYGSNSTTYTDIQGRNTVYQFNNWGNTINVRNNQGSAQFLKYLRETPDKNNKLSVQSKMQETIINFLKNHNAEQDGEWSAEALDGSTGSSVVTTEAKYLGSKSLKISKTNPVGTQSFSQQVNLNKGKTYVFSGYIKTLNVSTANNQGAVLEVEYCNSLGSWVTVASPFVKGSNDWERNEAEFTLPVDATSNTITTRFGIRGETGTAYFDCLQLEEGTIANRYNIVENPDFSYGSDTPTYWTKNSDCTSADTIVSDSTKGVTNLDDRCFAIVGSATLTKKLSQVINIAGKKGDVFVAGGWAKANSVPLSPDANRAFRIDVVFTKTDNTEKTVSVPFTEYYSNWQYAMDRIIPDSDYTKITLNIVYALNDNTAEFDGIQFYKEEFGTSYTYDAKGNIISTADFASQNSFTYSGNNDMVSATSPKGSRFQYQYDTKHNLNRAISSMQVITSFTNDSYGNPLTASIGGDYSPHIKYEGTYTANGNYLSTSKDPSGNITTNNYDETKGLLTSFIDPLSKRTDYTYDGMDNLTDVYKTADGQEVRNTYTYDHDFLKMITHNGFDYIFNYDSLKRGTGITVGSQPLVSNQYVPRTDKISETDFGNGQTVGYTYDGLDRVANVKNDGNVRFNYEYDASGNVGYQEDLVNGVNYRYTYDLSDRLFSITDDRLNSTRVGYDLNNNISKSTQKIDGNVYSTNYVYDLDNRPVLTSFNRYSTLFPQAEYFIFNQDTSGSKGTPALTSNPIYVNDENYSTALAAYEGTTNLLQNPSFENNLTNWNNYDLEFTYGGHNAADFIDGSNCAEFIYPYSPYYPPTGNVFSTQSIDFAPLTQSKNYTLSAWVKRTGSSQPAFKYKYYYGTSSSSTITYTANIPEGIWTKISYTFTLPQNTNRLLAAIGSTMAVNDNVRFDAVQLEEKPYATAYTSSTSTTNMLKYSLGLNSSSGTMSTWFNSSLPGTRDIIANEVGSGGILNLYLDNDDHLRLAVKDSAGNQVDLITTTELATKNTWNFTALKWQTSESTLNCTLNLNGNVYTAETDDFMDFTGAVTAVGSDTQGANLLNGMLELFAYAPNALNDTDINTMYTSSKGNSKTYFYDGYGRSTSEFVNTGTYKYTTSYNYRLGVNGGSTNLLNSITNNGSAISYTYDAKGNISTITQNGNVIQYYYNELNELTREDNPQLGKTITYSYDAGGNFTSKIEYPYTTSTPSNPIKTYSYAYDSSWKDLMTNYDGNTITYDAIGNPLAYNGWTYNWQAGRQLAGMSGNGYNTSYKYNDQGIRTQKTVNGVTTDYFLVNSTVTHESNGTDNVYYTYDANGSLISMNLNGTEYYYIRNGQGDIIGLYDGTGTQVVSYTYDTWGKLISIDGSLATTVGEKNPNRYRGYSYDTETGLYYLNSRYYNPDWGRFVNADSLIGKVGVQLSHNMFAYCGNNPVSNVDPTGSDWWDYVKAGAIGAFEGATDACLTIINPAAGVERVGAKLGAEFGIGSYKALTKMIKGTGFQAHHIIEKRFARRLGIDSDLMSSIALTKEQHQSFTNAWRALFPYGKTDYDSLTKEKIWEAAKDIYESFPDLLKAAKETIFGG